MLFAIFITYTNGHELPETRFDAISRVIDDVVERDLFYNIINQQDYQSDYVILFRAVGERTPFADVFARTLDEYKTSKEKIDYSCSFMEAFLVIELLGCFHQPEVAFLYQIKKTQSAVLIALGDAHDLAEVCRY